MRNNIRIMVIAVFLTRAMTGCTTSPSASDGHKPKQDDLINPSSTAEPQGYAEAVLHGDQAWEAQDFDRAIYFYVQAMDKSPGDALTLSKIGTIEDARGNAALAQKAFEMSHRANPGEPRVAERLARLYLKSGKVDDASKLYTQVLAADPNRSRALDGMGEVCVVRFDYDHAIFYFDRALQAETPDAATILTHRGYAKFRSRDLVGGEADLRSALAVPRREDAWGGLNDDAWRYLGDVLILRGDTAGALESLLNVMSTAEAFNEMGATLMDAKKYKDAREYFRKAISASAAWFESAQRNLALVDERLRDNSG